MSGSFRGRGIFKKYLPPYGDRYFLKIPRPQISRPQISRPQISRPQISYFK